MDLSTTYLGFDLPHPFMPGASPLVDDLDTVRRLEDAGAAAIVMHSLFEEQLVGEQLAFAAYADAREESHAEALSYLPRPADFALGPEEYLEQVRRIKAAVRVPVVASLNGRSLGGWLGFARLLQDAGADALELNVYELATDPTESPAVVEDRLVDMLRAVRQAVRLPLAVKLSPFYTALPHLACRLEQAGANGLVLFNRFYQPDIDIEALEMARTLHLSTSEELPLRTVWLAVLSAHTGVSLAASGGVHTAVDAIKAVMAGAHAVQMVSCLLRQGVEHLRTVREATARWLEAHEYDSLRQMQGSMNLARCPDPAALQRFNYVHMLQSWRTAAEASTPPR
ncbi:MAG: dihydroorotate dehydrogenase-like protein [Candidatus Binatia bacterium]